MTCTGKVLIKTLLKEKWTSIRHNSVDFITYIVQLAEVCRMRGRQINHVQITLDQILKYLDRPSCSKAKHIVSILSSNI